MANQYSLNYADRLHRVLYRSRLYAKMLQISIGRVPVSDLVRTQFPFLLADATIPSTVSVELTNYCNLACPYCTSPLKLRPEGLMSPTTFSNLVSQIKQAGIPRVLLVGNGEPTLHPNFRDYIPRLRDAAKFLSLTTNLQKVSEEILRCILNAPIDVVNISVDGGHKEAYERMRIGGKFERLLENLTRMRDLKHELHAPTLINVRVMLLPSQREDEHEILHFWRPYADVVSKQYIMNFYENFEDGYMNTYKPETRCTLPFKVLDVQWNGNVPLCSYSWIQIGEPSGFVLGNINETTLYDLWNGAILQQYRAGHRSRNEAMIPICKNCAGRT